MPIEIIVVTIERIKITFIISIALRGQLVGVDSFFYPVGVFFGFNSGLQAHVVSVLVL